jgi:predicted XRE-type DNA-binding protein
MNIHNLNREQFQELLESYDRNTICEKYKISIRTLSRIIKHFKLNRPNYGPKKLTAEDVANIRYSYMHKDITQKQLAKMFEVNQSTIAKIVNHNTHKFVEEPTIKISGSAEVKVYYKYKS